MPAKKAVRRKIAPGKPTPRKKTVRKKKIGKAATGKKVARKSAQKVARKVARKKVARETIHGEKTTTGKKLPSPKAGIEIVFRSPEGKTATIVSDAKLQDRAMRWRYRLTKRIRWKQRADKKQQQEQLDRELQELTGGSDLLGWIGEARFVEVRIPYTTETDGWEARIAPWEYLLSAVSKLHGRTGDFTVIRHLERPVPRQARRRPVATALFVQACPGKLQDFFSFDVERKRVSESLGLTADELINPTLEELRERVVQTRPGLIHLAGLDTHQARQVIERERDELDPDGVLLGSWPRYDGVVLRSAKGGPKPIEAGELALALNAGDQSPELVYVNLYNSASRICALTVAEGARHAIGFQDTIDDQLGEMLLAGFYSDYRNAGWQALPAFNEAIRSLRRAPQKMVGTGIVLWSDRGLLKTELPQARTYAEDQSKIRAQRIVVGEDEDYDWLEFDIRTKPTVNYSLMHNNLGCLFENLTVYKKKPGTLRGLEIEAVLHVGSDSFPYRRRCDMDDTKPLDLASEISVPLTSDLIRSVPEPLKTSLFVEIRHEQRVVKRETYRVTLLPADEWKDTDADRLWLPSFVLPRDPAVASIVDQAQSHLMTLSDDRTRGFDGYQGVDEADLEATMENVDLQVQALWAAIVHHYQVRYINPPPTYTTDGQRLRTPTQILAGRRGTCIDLALLIAACLEYVDIHPVVFLLEGHAFAGYWRWEGDRETFFDVRYGNVEKEELKTSTGSTQAVGRWIVAKPDYSDILLQIRENRLFPIEAVGLTTHGSFWEAIDEGLENLRSPREFHSMIDIRTAREAFVTPLPIKEEPFDERA